MVCLDFILISVQSLFSNTHSQAFTAEHHWDGQAWLPCTPISLSQTLAEEVRDEQSLYILSNLVISHGSESSIPHSDPVDISKLNTPAGTFQTTEKLFGEIDDCFTLGLS